MSRAGFTILEILIAIVVLVLGITGIIALFPTAIESGNKTVEDSYAAAITQSVVDALAVGVRESRYTTKKLGTRVYTYFIFNHDGVVDEPPTNASQFDAAPSGAQGAIWRRDYCVILPQNKSASTANTAIQDEPNFIYPVPTLLDPTIMNDPAQEAARIGDAFLNQRAPTRLNTPSNLVDNLSVGSGDQGYLRPSAAGGAQVPWISRVYRLGRYRDPPGAGALPTYPGTTQNALPGDIRMEYLGESVTIGGSQQQAIAVDPYPSYGFCFSLQRARVDTTGAGAGSPPDGRITAQDQFSDSLYTLRVKIFKNFDERAAFELRPNPGTSENDPPFDTAGAVPRQNVHIREFVTLIAL